MKSILRFIILASGTLFTLSVVYLLVKKKLNERDSLLWLIGSLIVLIMSIAPSIIIKLAEIAGVDYPPTLLFLVATLMLLFITLYHSVQISVLNNQIRELTQFIAIHEFRENRIDFKIVEKEIEKSIRT